MRSTSTASGCDSRISAFTSAAVNVPPETLVLEMSTRGPAVALRPEQDDRLVGDDECIWAGRAFYRLDRPRHLGRRRDVVPVQTSLLLVHPGGDEEHENGGGDSPRGPGEPPIASARLGPPRSHMRRRGAPDGDR